MKKLSLLCISAIAVVVVSTFTVAHAANIRVTPSGPGVFILQGENLSNIGGIKAVISYNPPALQPPPRVEKGSLIANASGHMFMPNTSVPGQIIIAAINPSGGFNGTGPIAILNLGNPQARVTGISGIELVDEQTKKLDNSEIKSEVINPSDPSDETPDKTPPVTAGGQTPPAGQGSSTAYLGTITMPDGSTSERQQESSRRDDEQTQNQAEPRHVPRESEQVASAQETSKPKGEKKFVAHKGLADQIKELKEVTPKSVLGLVEKYSVPGVRQEPEVLLSDGKSKVKLFLNLPGKDSPNFALKGAKLSSLKNEEKDKWVVEALPAKGSSDVRLTIIQGDVMTEVPLLVAQPLPSNVMGQNSKLDPTTFELFLKERGAEKAPKHDLNGDGARTYLDDYIFTVNYIAKNGMPRKAAPEVGKAVPANATPAAKGTPTKQQPGAKEAPIKKQPGAKEAPKKREPVSKEGTKTPAEKK